MNRFPALLALLSVFVLVMTVAGCPRGLTPEERAAMTPAHVVYQIQGDYNVALAAAVRYAEQPRCTAERVVACSDQNAINTLAAFDSRMHVALEAARAAEGDDALVAAASTARAILAEFQAELLALGGQ